MYLDKGVVLVYFTTDLGRAICLSGDAIRYQNTKLVWYRIKRSLFQRHVFILAINGNSDKWEDSKLYKVKVIVLAWERESVQKKS